MSGPGFVVTKFNDIVSPGGNPFDESLTDSIGLDDTPSHEAVQLQGLGEHAPAGGAWQLFARLDVTQSSQVSYNSGSAASVTFTGTRWTTPDATGGAFFGLDDGTYKFMRFRWEVGAPGDGRIAQCTLTDSGANWPEMYVRMVARTNWPHDPWPSSQVKMIDWQPGNCVLDWDKPQWSSEFGGIRYFLGNVTSAITSQNPVPGAGYWTVTEDWPPDPITSFCENEFYALFNTDVGQNGNGIWRNWAGDVGSTVEVTNWDILGSGGTHVTFPTDVIYAPLPAGLQQFLFGPYLGGQGGGNITTQSDIEFGMLEVYVR